MFVLLIDIGNTSIHWRLYSKESNVTKPTFSLKHNRDWHASITQLVRSIAGFSIGQVLIANVSGQAIEKQLNEHIEYHLKLLPVFIKSAREGKDVINAYQDPEKLGVDRWLAVQASCLLCQNYGYGAALVVDAGTAMTIDAVLSNGEHLGGSILAGLYLQQTTLLKNTQQISATASAVYRGALLGLTGAVKESLRGLLMTLNEQDGCEVIVVLTGGDAESIESGLLDLPDIDILQVDNLVLDGLELYV